MFELMLPALVAALLLAASHGYLGLHIIARGVIFVDLALAQVAALGYTAATLLGLGPSSPAAYAMGLGATLLGAFIFSVSRIRHPFITQEAIIGIVYVVASAATILLAAQAPRGSEHVEDLLTGTLLWVGWGQIARTALVYAGIFGTHWFLRKRFLTISLQPAVAREEGWSLTWWDFLFYALFGLVVTMSVAIAGVLLVFSFLVIPAVIAYLFTRRPAALLALALSSGTAATLLGLFVSASSDLPTGPTVVCAFGLALLVAFGVRRLMGPGTVVEREAAGPATSPEAA
ncbi:MAG: metal ABC transporter permease [Gemmatimonadota bacterium]